MYGINEANEYLSKMRAAVKDSLVNPDSIYYGKDGHLRFARECGYALNDFDEKARTHIIQASYGTIYVIGCHLMPILDAKDWQNEMTKMIIS